MHKLSKIIQYVCKQNELLRVKHGRSDVVEQLCTLDSDSNARYLVILVPEPI